MMTSGKSKGGTVMDQYEINFPEQPEMESFGCLPGTALPAVGRVLSGPVLFCGTDDGLGQRSVGYSVGASAGFCRCEYPGFRPGGYRPGGRTEGNEPGQGSPGAL